MANILIPEKVFSHLPPPVPWPQVWAYSRLMQAQLSTTWSFCFGKINQFPHSAHRVSESGSYWYCMERHRLLLKIKMIFKHFHWKLIQLVNKLCNVASIIYSQRVQDAIYPSWIMHSKQVPISDDDYAPEHLIKPLTLWYPSNQDNCTPLSCFSTMTRPAMLEEGQLLKLQRHRCQQWSEKWERLHMLKRLEKEMFKNRLRLWRSWKADVPSEGDAHAQNSIGSAKT